MLKLSSEQIEQAAKAAFEYNYYSADDRVGMQCAMPVYREMVIRAAPFLQAPWEPPTDVEKLAFERATYNNGIPTTYALCWEALDKFVARRNDTQAAPVDSKRERVMKILHRIWEPAPGCFDELADAIIDVLKEKHDR